MSHQTQIEKLKYRNWMKGGLSMKYLKDGLEKFADDVVRQDHTRILQQIRHTTGLICTSCTLRDLKPVHKYVIDSRTKRKCCPRGQSNCNCLYSNKSNCPNKICDAIYEEILNSHASRPPAPCFKNTDITKWATNPWEVAKCFINAPGYRDKQTAEEIDVAGLLHVFINNTMYQTSLSCLISGNKSDAFCKVLDLRNTIFHSPNMELEDHDLNECLINVVSILKDEKKLKDTKCAKEAVDNIKQRLDSMEEDIENLKNLYKKKLKSVEKRLDDKKKLAEHLQRHYVKTSVCPLKTRVNAIDIDKVYVDPLIETEKDNDLNEKRTVSLTSYRSIFQSNGHRMRRIYLLGEVGSGKSAFCKMMILNWCKSVKNNRTINAKEDNVNVETMKQFDFLFYLPLRRLQKGGKIREMIFWYYKDDISEDLDDILLNVPEKCLILADGLDEWTPNYDEQRPHHVTGSLPYSEDIKEVTLLTTSRPSAPGVLNMAFTEFDLKITIRGIPAKSIKSMTEKYLLSLSKESNPDTVLENLNAKNIDHIEKTPLLLQQLIWMIAHDIDVGKCLSDYYSSLVNIALKWAEEKDNHKKLKTVSSCHISAELHLPSKLMQYDACWSNRNLLFILGKLAYDLFINADSQMSFGRVKLNRDGLDDDMIYILLTTGLLTEDNCHDNTKQNTRLAFTHASFQEYFAALYIASHVRTKTNQNTDDTKHIRRKSFFEIVYFWFLFYVFNRLSMEQMRSPGARYQSQNEDIIELFFTRFSSVQDILQFSVLLRMLCGLAPEILLDVCEHIYRTAQGDIKYSMIRDQYLTKTSGNPYLDEYVTMTLNIQKLIKNCVFECNVIGDTSAYKVPVLDLIISDRGDNEYTALLQCVISEKVLHLSFTCGFSGSRSDLYQNYIVEFHNLQTISIYLFHTDITKPLMTPLSQHISETNSVRKIKFITNKGIDGLPVINLLGHHQLQLINISVGTQVINVDTTNLEVIVQADLSEDDFMSKIPGQGLYNYDCFRNMLSRGDVIPKLRHLELSRIITTQDLGKFISHNVTLNVVRLLNLFIIRGHLRCVIDLSAHNDLQILEIIDTFNVDIKSVNTTNLNTVTTDRSDVLYAVRNAAKLTLLTFGRCRPFASTICYTKQMNEDMCSCSQLRKIDLILVEIQDEALEMSCGMRNLKCITLSYVGIGQSTWIRFVNSLLNLNQSVTVKAKWVNDADTYNCIRYVRDNENKFKLIESDYMLAFETVP